MGHLRLTQDNTVSATTQNNQLNYEVMAFYIQRGKVPLNCDTTMFCKNTLSPFLNTITSWQNSYLFVWYVFYSFILFIYLFYLFLFLFISSPVSDGAVHVCVYPRRPVYVSAVRPQSKHIVVMVDHGASVTETQLQIARDSALVILNAIDEHDKVNERDFTSSSSPSFMLKG